MKLINLSLLLVGFICLQAATFAASRALETGLALENRAAPECPLVRCIPQEVPGDARCTLTSMTRVHSNGCPTCGGCQKCPDLKIYDNDVTDYCSAQPSTSCPRRPGVICLIACLTDKRCKALPFDREAVTCGCSCQECPDGKIYGSTGNFSSIEPLSTINAAQCPHVLHPVPQPIDQCLAAV